MSFCYAAFFLAATILAQEGTGPRSDQLLITGSNGTDPPFGQSAFNNAEQNATRDVSFVRGSQNWTWTLSISDVELPNTANRSEYTSGWNAAPDSRVAFTKYSINWPQEGNINQVVRAEPHSGAVSTTSCLYNVWSDFPENVTSAWDPASSSCASAIGEECEQYITRSLVNQNGCATENLSGLSLSRNCPGSFGTYVAVFGFTFGNVSVPSDDTAFESGDTISYTVSDLASPGNFTALDHAKNRLHMVVMDSSQGKSVLCNRIAGADAGASASASTAQAGISMVWLGAAALTVVGLGNM